MAGAIDHEILINKVEEQLNLELPGQKAQFKMAPEHRIDFPESTNHAKLSSVLLLLYPHHESIHIVFIKRATYDGHHSGQISLPGGKFEKNDPSLIHTALRECSEEIGINANEVKVIGNLSSLFIPVSNMMVLPVVGYHAKEPIFVPDFGEVNRIIEVELEYLLNPVIVKKGTVLDQYPQLQAPYFEIDEHKIWGATAMIISEFLEVMYPII